MSLKRLQAAQYAVNEGNKFIDNADGFSCKYWIKYNVWFMLYAYLQCLYE